MNQSETVARIEELMRDLADESDTPNALMHEHLESARYYLTGSMPGEYNFTLDLARNLLPEIEDEALRARVGDFLRSQQSVAV